MKKTKSTGKTALAFLLMALFVGGAFYLVSNRSEQIAERQAAKMTPVQEVLARDLKTNYPATPKEVVKFYSEISRCFYGEEYSEEELKRLAAKSREVFDDELVANQTDEQYLNALRRDIETNKIDKKTISSFSVSSSTDVEYYDFQGDEWAQLYCFYTFRISTSVQPIQEKFLLRKDSDGHWKIFGWKLVEQEDAQ